MDVNGGTTALNRRSKKNIILEWTFFYLFIVWKFYFIFLFFFYKTRQKGYFQEKKKENNPRARDEKALPEKTTAWEPANSFIYFNQDIPVCSSNSIGPNYLSFAFLRKLMKKKFDTTLVQHQSYKLRDFLFLFVPGNWSFPWKSKWDTDCHWCCG